MTDALPTTLRRDAARNRQKILQAARAAITADRRLGFNELARDAEVGVGTVYRHFATVEALRAELAADALEELLVAGHAAAAMDDPRAALATFLRSAVLAQLRDDVMAQVVETQSGAGSRIEGAKAELFGIFSRLIGRATAAGVVSPHASVGDVVAMLCGVGHTARLYPAAEAEAAALRFLDVVIAGLGQTRH